MTARWSWKWSWRKKGQVRHVGADSGYRRYGQYSVVRQKTALGLGHAVYCAKNFIGNEPFAVMLGDDIVDSPGYPLSQTDDGFVRAGSNVLFWA